MTKPKTVSGGFAFRFHPRILGTPAPLFPGFEVDISDHVPDSEKPDAVWHRHRARDMIRNHPEIKKLFGPTPSTAIYCVIFAALQIGLAIAMGWLPWWVALITAYVVGGLINMNLFMLAHECNHSLVFRGEPANRWLFTLTSLPMFLSGHHAWWIEHHVHHNDLGAKKDFIKRRRSFFLLTRTNDFFGLARNRYMQKLSCLLTPLFFPYALTMLVLQVFRSLLGLLVYFFSCLLLGRLTPSNRVISILGDEHLVSGYDRYRLRHWAILYPLLSLTMVGLLFWFVGWKAVFYLLMSALFTTGFLHPLLLGMILSNSHFHGHKRYQPSASHYSWFNWLTFNFGYHTEHHDLCRVAWSRLPQVRAIAAESYDTLLETPSYSRLALQYVFGSSEEFEQNFDSEVHRNMALAESEEAMQEAGCTKS